MIFEQYCDVTIRKTENETIENVFLWQSQKKNVLSALSMSLTSLQGTSSKLVGFVVPFIGLPIIPGMPPLRLWSIEILRGRGGTAGLPLLGGCDWASSELESSCPAVDRFTVGIGELWLYRVYRLSLFLLTAAVRICKSSTPTYKAGCSLWIAVWPIWWCWNIWNEHLKKFRGI